MFLPQMIKSADFQRYLRKLISIGFGTRQLQIVSHNTVKSHFMVTPTGALKGSANTGTYFKHLSSHIWNTFKPTMSTCKNIFRLLAKERQCKEKKWESNKYRDKGCVCDAQEYVFIINPAIFFFNLLTSCQINLTTVVLRNFISKFQLNQNSQHFCSYTVLKKIYKVNCSGGVLIHP